MSIDYYQQASSLLLQPAQLSTTNLEDCLAIMAGRGVDYADLYFEYCCSENWSLDEGIVKSASFNIDQGVGVRAVHGEKTAFAYSDDISLAALEDAAKTVRSIADHGQSTSCSKLKTFSPPQALFLSDNPLNSLEAADKVALLNKVEKITRQLDSRIVQVMASLSSEYSVILVANLTGRLAADIRPLVRLSITVIMEENGRREQGYSGGGGRYSYAYFDDACINKYAEEAVFQASINLQAVAAPAGQMPVVLGSGWPGILLHEAIGHGLEGDFNRKGSSAFAGKIGQQVAAKGVTVVDDGTIINRRGSLNIDDEGQPSQCTTLIEDGILRAYMQDSMNARLMGVQSTGNARRQSYAHLPLPRMTNTMMLNGSYEHDEIISAMKNGIYAANFGGGQVDITSGKFVFSMVEAYLVENGKITHPVRGATLIGNGADALTHIKMIGNNLALDSGVGSCGKEGQSVPVGVGQPSILIEGLTVGGTG